MNKLVIFFIPAMVGLVLINPARGQNLDQSIEQIAQHMLNDHPLKAPRNNLAIMKFRSARGAELEMGDYLMRKIRIRMFDLDKAKNVRFVSQGKVTDLLVKQGLKNAEVVFDERQRVEFGQLLTADHLVHGTYELLGNGSVEIVALLVAVKTGETLAQAVLKVKNPPGDLLVAKGGPSIPIRHAYRFSGKKLATSNAARKTYRMGTIFKKRGRQDESRELFNQVISKYPDSLEALYSQFQIMTEDVIRLKRERRYDDQFLKVLLNIPEQYQRGSFYKELQKLTVEWLVDLARNSLRKNKGDGKAKFYFDNAKKLGLSTAKAMQLQEQFDTLSKTANEQARAKAIRAKLKQGRRDEAEMLLVEWESDDPDSIMLDQIKSEFERPAGMVTIPGGRVNRKNIKSFNLDQCEVTNNDFLSFVKKNPEFRKSRIAKGMNDKDYLLRWGGDQSFPSKVRNIPVVFVSQKVATAYCKWAGKRLPTFPELGLAAGESKQTYPWGDKAPNDDLANFGKGLFGGPTPCESHPLGATPEKVYHLAGNVWELTSTIIDRGVEKGEAMSWGGSYFDESKVLRNDNRILSGDPVAYSSRFTGFRCAQ